MSESGAGEQKGPIEIEGETFEGQDRALTAVTYDGAFRVIVLSTTKSVRAVCERQEAQGANAGHLADLVTGTTLVRLTMAPSLRVQGIVRDAHGGTLVADSWPGGATRGLLQLKKGAAEITVDQDTRLMTMRSLPRGDVHRSVVGFPSEGGVSGALMSYMSASEQITSMVAVGHLREGDRVVAAGGYIVQLLPEVSQAPLAIMAERLDHDFADRAALVAQIEADPEAVLGELLYGMPFEQTRESYMGFGCQCSKVRVLSSLATLPKEEILDLARSPESLEIDCDYCKEHYVLDPRDLRGLLEPS